MSASFMATPPDQDASGRRPPTPTAPPYSPITPPVSFSQLAGHDQQVVRPHGQAHSQLPPPIPISESDNPDAIALRATLGVLQVQRQRALSDLKQLERQKQLATSDPRAFVARLAKGEIEQSHPDPVGSTDGNTDTTTDEPTHRTTRADDHDPDAGKSAGRRDESFGPLPGPQAVVRCPPVNWAQYGVVGEALDGMHEEQRRHPSSTRPDADEVEGTGNGHVIAAPYNPWTDHLNNGSPHVHPEPSGSG